MTLVFIHRFARRAAHINLGCSIDHYKQPLNYLFTALACRLFSLSLRGKAGM